MTEEEPAIDLIKRWRQGDQRAADLLYGRYFEQMMRIIGAQIPAKIRGRVAPEDVAQSVFRTVFRRLRRGEFQFQDDQDIWKLLVTVALNKTRSQTSKNLAARRDVNRETRIGDVPIDESLSQRLQSQPSISEVLAFRETLALLFARLANDEVEVIQLRLEGYTQEEIATRLQVTTRTVRRKLTTIRQAVGELLDARDGQPGDAPSGP